MASSSPIDALDLVVGVGTYKDNPYSEFQDARNHFGTLELRQNVNFDTKAHFKVYIGHKSLLEVKDPNAGLNYLGINAVFELF